MAVPRLTASMAMPVPRTAALATVSSSLGRRATRLLPVFKGLRICTRLPGVPFATSSRAVCRGAVICEAPEMTTERNAFFLSLISSAYHIIVPDVSKATWKSLVMDSDVPVLVGFWAPWCGPCRMIEPTILKLAKVYEGKLRCYKLNTDENPDITTQYGIRSIPTMMIFKNGEKKDAVIGAVPESTLVISIEKFVVR
ncbi:hypothetical protein B296_00001029 [Ensete ventricosum]|uniref:Thioredoxin domain-containing protein n=1 Tax=Ensete ventricosum TaxID=4639 RepID=A0A427AZD4_ENSVE|nr:hypothetical protein B296_00001029 [Ensete ventricosum]